MRDFGKKWNQELGTYWLAPDKGVIQSRIGKIRSGLELAKVTVSATAGLGSSHAEDMPN